ncbi:hypothetical protein FA10DRAFT_263773 [Acaromyces ingoldii]|uniref:Shr3 amino acid permease chaperone n=1 Tax=Acaromyces ingoldii TaxID=215250 RepID=A0A316YWL9_9BASI|nr:hypothetical protein FA10DRAFT_263773 [Acaromyces ingoldii]PWN93068.1 hypothetical protein FA10DRAFT_263773 [Acaromyces ingoldii]
MGDLSTAIVVIATSFLLGTLAMHWTADHLVLWQSPVTRPSLLSAHIYYSHTLVSMPEYFTIGQYAVGTLGGVMLLAKVLGGRESNWLFDGASLFLYGASGIVYLQKIVPSLRALPATSPQPAADPMDPKDNVLLPLRDLASSNAVLAVALVGVLILQSGQYYSERLERRERVEENEARLRRKRRKLERAQ